MLDKIYNVCLIKKEFTNIKLYYNENYIKELKINVLYNKKLPKKIYNDDELIFDIFIKFNIIMVYSNISFNKLLKKHNINIQDFNEYFNNKYNTNFSIYKQFNIDEL